MNLWVAGYLHLERKKKKGVERPRKWACSIELPSRSPIRFSLGVLCYNTGPFGLSYDVISSVHRGQVLDYIWSSGGQVRAQKHTKLVKATDIL
jgi:hypothetical protein